MASFGLSDSGFLVKRLPDILTDHRQRATELFQDQVPPGDVVDTSDSSALGRLIALDSPGDADLWEVAQMVYSAFDPNSSTGIALDNLVSLGGISRIPESKTTADVYFEGDVNTTISPGLVFRSSTTGVNYSTKSDVPLAPTQGIGIGIALKSVDVDNSYTISYRANSLSPYINITVASGSNPTIESIYTALELQISTTHLSLTTYRKNGRLFIKSAVDLVSFDFACSDNILIQKAINSGVAVAAVFGPFAQPVGTIDTIVTPILGWDSVTNPISAVAGRLRETDEELRLRFRNTKFERSTNIIESLYSALFSVIGVNNVVIYENDTNVVDVNNLPPHSFLVLIDGGLPSDIGNAIWKNRPTGITSVGNSTVTIIDKFGYTREIKYSRPAEVPVYIQIKLTTNSIFPSDGQEQIRNALITYINSLTINDDVVYSRLYTPINSIPGHQVDSLEIGTALDSLATSNIVTQFDEIAKTSSVKIVFI